MGQKDTGRSPGPAAHTTKLELTPHLPLMHPELGRHGPLDGPDTLIAALRGIIADFAFDLDVAAHFPQKPLW
ncbi:MAG TPA: hypothetical protein VG034_03865 [Acidimicrobiia bacterium]|nr:hypothetical protein [Acidimicrobiia bacterium]